jgi:hypothetical protein
VANTSTQTFTVTNSQTLLNNAARPFTISTITVAKTGGGAGSYARATGANAGTCVVGNTLAVGASCTVGVTFTSPTNSTTTGTITVQGTNPSSPGVTFTATRNMTGS